MWNPDDAASDLIDSFYNSWEPTEEELDALFAELILIDLIELELNAELDALFSTYDNPIAA